MRTVGTRWRFLARPKSYNERVSVNRRNFLSVAAASTALTGALRPLAAVAQADQDTSRSSRFKLKYAPHFNMFRHLAGKDLVDQLKFAADEGFSAWEDNGMKGRDVAQQERIAGAMEQLSMEMGVISALRGLWNTVNFAGGDAAAREQVLAAMRDIVDVAKRVNTKLLTVVLGMANPKLPSDYQTASCVELLKQCCDILAPHGLVMVLEPLNRQKNHPGVFLYSAPHAYLICRAVNHPSCKILFDIYHQQISVGNLIPNIEKCWDEIAYYQSGDTPGRNEPGTGEINYQNVLRHIYEKGYRGVFGMEHGNSRPGAAGERSVIDAYRRVDPS
jgi:hydroxypyruvate isomerase